MNVLNNSPGSLRQNNLMPVDAADHNRNAVQKHAQNDVTYDNRRRKSGDPTECKHGALSCLMASYCGCAAYLGATPFTNLENPIYQVGNASSPTWRIFLATGRNFYPTGKTARRCGTMPAGTVFGAKTA